MLAIALSVSTLVYGMQALPVGVVSRTPAAVPLSSTRLEPTASRLPSQAVVGSIPSASLELPGLRTRSSRTYLVNGQYEAVVYSGPVNYQDAQGAWQAIDDSLVPSSVPGYRYQNKANGYTLLLPSNLASAPVRFQDASGSVGFQLVGAAGAPSAAGATATYANALPGVTMALTTENDAIKETLTLDGPQSPTSFTYLLSVSPGLTATTTSSGAIAVSDGKGRLQFSLELPFMYDSSGSADSGAVPVSLKLAGSGGPQSITVSAGGTWLSSATRRWPVIIDPSVGYNADQDCSIINGSYANTNFCGGASPLHTGYGATSGYVSRSALLFNVQNAVPVGAQVTHAGLALNLEYISSSNYDSIGMHQLTQSWSNAVTWNDYDGSHAWSSAGGTFNATDLAAQTPTTAGWYYWSGSGPSQLAQSWLSNPSSNDGILLKADNEATDETYTFGSTRTGSSPYYFVYYVNALGERGTYGVQSHQLTDRSQLSVNVANGNLVVTGNDVSIQGTGLNLAIQRIYNSLGQGGAFGSWLMGSGADEHLTLEDGNVDFQGSGGWDLTFLANGGAYTPPPGLDANLVKNGDGTYTLTFNSSQEQLNFTSAGVLTSDSDRNGDTISYSTSSGNVTSITDTQGRQVTLAYASPIGEHLISSITDSTSREWKYSYQSANGFDELTQYTDPAGKVTSYSYDTSGRISQITDPLGNETKFGYDSQSRVTSIIYVTNLTLGTGPTTSYTYNTGAGSCAAAPTGDSVFGNTVSTDANSHATTYCYDPQGLVLQVIDPDAHSGASSFTPDQHVAASTDALSQTTTATYNANNDLTKITPPALGSGQTPAAPSSGFSTPSSVAGYQYLPSSVTDAQGNCTAYTYDAGGNLTDSYSGQTSPCDGDTGGTHVQNKYQGDAGVSCGAKAGQLCSTTDGRGNQTSYGYDSNGNLTSTTPPSPLGETTIVPDALSRVSSITDGKSQKTSYTYDQLDRVTQILYNGATTCTPSSGNCITYVYDGDGNVTSTVDNTGTTSYYYDALNRLTTESLPDTGSDCSGSSPAGITFAYDGVGNLLQSCDSGGTTSYAYDAANRPLSVAEPGGSCGATPSLCTTFTYTANGQRSQVAYPGGATLNTTYDNDGNVSSVIGKDKNGSVLSSFTYTYNVGSTDTGLRQTMAENDAVATHTYSYSYDALSRLTAAAITAGSGTGYTYSYDASGNITSRLAGAATTSYAYNAANELCWVYAGSSSNACASAPSGATTYSFDGNGNETGSSAGAAFSYNPKNQTTAITNAGTTLSSLAYSGIDQTQRTAAGSTSFANAAGGVALATTSGSSTYYLRDSQGSLLGERIGSDHYYYLTDGLGSIVAVISGDGLTLGDRYGYDPYGNTTYHSGTVANPWGFAGGYTDPTGLVKFGTRYYDPTLGRWTQQDPITGTINDPGTLNRYIYAACNPINAVDPTGYFCWYYIAIAVSLFYASTRLAIQAVAIEGLGPWWSFLAFIWIAAALYLAKEAVDYWNLAFRTWCRWW